MNWINRLTNPLAKMPPPKPEAQNNPHTKHQQLEICTISTTQIGEIAGMQLPSQLLKNLGVEPRVQTKTGFFWATEDVPIIFLKLSKYFADKAREELNKL